MPRVHKINFELPTLRKEIKSIRNPNNTVVKNLYGTFGLDIYEGKKDLTILSPEEVKKSKTLWSKIKTWFTGNRLLDYEDNDKLRDVVFKYAGNKNAGLVGDIRAKFGQRGVEELERLYLSGLVHL